MEGAEGALETGDARERLGVGKGWEKNDGRQKHGLREMTHELHSPYAGTRRQPSGVFQGSSA